MPSKEQILRKRLVAIAKKAFEHRLMAGTWGNLSARIGRDRILLTPSGFEKDLLKPSDLLVVDLNGKVMKGRWKPTIETPMHTSIYRAREDVNAVVHTHSHYATLFAVLGQPIPILTLEFASAVGHEVQVTRYVRAGTEEAAEEVVRALGDGRAVLIRNHGVVAVGDSLEDAYHVAILVEDEARTYFLLKLLGEPIQGISREEVEALREFYVHKYGQEGKKILLRD